MLVTADTNLLASGFVRRKEDTAPVQFLDAWRAGQFSLAVSQHILAELRKTLSTPYFRRHLAQADAEAFVALLATDALLLPPTAQVTGIATHPEDDLVLATALSGPVNYLVTGDIKLQRLGSYEGIIIVSPRAFVDTILPQIPRTP